MRLRTRLTATLASIAWFGSSIRIISSGWRRNESARSSPRSYARHAKTAESSRAMSAARMMDLQREACQ